MSVADCVYSVLLVHGVEPTNAGLARAALAPVSEEWARLHAIVVRQIVCEHSESAWATVCQQCIECNAAARPGLGDYVHAGLAAVGITPERVAAALGVDDCGCEERRQTLNEWGYAIGIGTPTGPTG